MIYEIHENWYLTKTNDLAVEENPPQIRDEENSFNFCHLHKNIISTSPKKDFIKVIFNIIFQGALA
jgi:hypothetical protein